MSEPTTPCGICFGDLEMETTPTTCSHKFCFGCLKQWIVKKAICPLCRRPIQKIVFTDERGERREMSVDELKQRRVSLCFPWWLAHNVHKKYYLLEAGAQQRYSQTAFTSRIALIKQLENSSGTHVRDLQPEILIWRRLVYANGLYAIPMTGASALSETICTSFFIENPQQLDRVTRFFDREVIALLGNNREVFRQVIRFGDNLKVMNIMSRAFRSILQPLFREHTTQLLHEIVAFAKSIYDMQDYDRKVEYTRDRRGMLAITSLTLPELSYSFPTLSYLSNNLQGAGQSSSTDFSLPNSRGPNRRRFAEQIMQGGQLLSSPVSSLRRHSNSAFTGDNTNSSMESGGPLGLAANDDHGNEAAIVEEPAQHVSDNAAEQRPDENPQGDAQYKAAEHAEQGAVAASEDVASPETGGEQEMNEGADAGAPAQGASAFVADEGQQNSMP